MIKMFKFSKNFQKFTKLVSLPKLNFITTNNNNQDSNNIRKGSVINDLKQNNNNIHNHDHDDHSNCGHNHNHNHNHDHIHAEEEMVQHLSEYKQAMTLFNLGKFTESELYLKECLKIFKNTNQTESLSYLFILKKFANVLFLNKKYLECEEILKASIELAKLKFGENEENLFNFKRNLIAFYTYTNIELANKYVEEVKEQAGQSQSLKYYLFADGAIKVMYGKIDEAKKSNDRAAELSFANPVYQGHLYHNIGYTALLNQGNEKQGILMYKQALVQYELETLKENRNEREKELLTGLLLTDKTRPAANEIDELIQCFKSGVSGLTITNLAEHFFEKGKEFEKDAAFWLKVGIKYYPQHENSNISKHLIIFALFYSQLGQTLLAEGLYRKAIELLQNDKSYHLSLALNMYGRLISSDPKRSSESQSLLFNSEQIIKELPYWYNHLHKLRFLDFDFN